MEEVPKQNEQNSLRGTESKRGVHPNSIANLRMWPKGVSGNPQGPKPIGATLIAHVNAIGAKEDLTEAMLVKISKDKDAHPARRAAADELLRLINRADYAEFTGFLKGNEDIDDLSAAGIDTRKIKKIKQKSRVVNVADGEVEEVIEREIELHADAPQTFDRLVNHTIGMPLQRIQDMNQPSADVGSAGLDYNLLTEDELAQLQAISERYNQRQADHRQGDITPQT